jgi:predicted ATPase
VRHRTVTLTVTLTGAAGVGETRLAFAAAREWDHPQTGAGGAWLVKLAGAAEHTPLAEAVTRALGIALPGLQRADDELVDVLRTRSLLLVPDNCERRVQDAGRLAERLARDMAGLCVPATCLVALLTGRPRDAPARPQTLRGAIAWSHALFSDDERCAFRRLGSFAGRCLGPRCRSGAPVEPPWATTRRPG